MYWETLPSWIWIVFYAFLLATLLTAIFSIISKKLKCLSAVAIIVTITIPINGIINSIGREPGVNEFEHLISQLQLGSFWAIYSSIGLLYLLFWWIVFFIRQRKFLDVDLEK